MMDEVVDLLIKRMDSNPEEFCYGWDPDTDNHLYVEGHRSPKWRQVIYQLRQRVGEAVHESGVPKPLPFLSDEQIARLYTKYVEVQGNEFEKYVLRTLLHGGDGGTSVPTYAATNLIVKNATSYPIRLSDTALQSLTEPGTVHPLKDNS